jgi:hypothetical protein
MQSRTASATAINVSRPLVINARADTAARLRIPAAEIEQIVVSRIRRLLAITRLAEYKKRT